MSIDYTGAEGGRMAAAFASGCVATWIFIRNLVMKPAIKSCRDRCAELEQDRDRLIKRVETLETVLMMHGNSDIRAAIQGALSELRMEMKGAVS